MPYVAQCPHSNCKKYMLLEDGQDASSAKCLACKKVMTIGAPTVPMDEDELVELVPSTTVPGLTPIPTPKHAAVQPTPKFIVKSCPKCGTPLRVATGEDRQAMQCTNCNFWGMIR